jgi:ABC-type uncharacterized transport system permease subunit
VRGGFPSNPVISFSAAKYLAFSAGHDDINGCISIPLAGYTNNLVMGEHVIFIIPLFFFGNSPAQIFLGTAQ